VLASPKPTKKAETDPRAASKRIAAAKAKLAEIHDHAVGDGYERIWPGGITAVLMRVAMTDSTYIHVPSGFPALRNRFIMTQAEVSGRCACAYR
jgi:hypothetical protein